MLKEIRNARLFQNRSACETLVRYLALLRRSAIGLALMIVCQAAFAQAIYRITPLGFLGGCMSQPPIAYAVNASDEVTGVACNAHGDLHAFLWKNNGTPMIDLGPGPAGTDSAGYGINKSGLVVGTATDSTGTYAFVSSGAAMTKIPNGLGGTGSFAYGVNDSGQVTGGAGVADGTSDAFVWKKGAPMVDIVQSDATFQQESYGYAINASGQVAGSQYDGDRSTNPFVWLNNGSPPIYLGGAGEVQGSCCITSSGQVAGTISVSGYAHPQAFVWRNDGTGMHTLGAVPGGDLSEAAAQNESGQIAGGSWTGYFKKELAFVWMNNGTPMKSLGTLGGTNSQSNDINASAQVTGWADITGNSTTHAFLWRNDGSKIVDLNTLIDSMDPLKPYITLTSGEFIDQYGDIVANGTDSRTGKSDLYLLQGSVLTLNPRVLAFGNVKTGTASAAKSVTMTNTSAKAAAISSITLAGAAANQFTSTNNCGKSLAGHAVCTIKVTFKPTSKGAKAATLSVNGGGGGTRVVNLTGTGT
jgi:probable HAF family extracellular repeat protein